LKTVIETVEKQKKIGGKMKKTILIIFSIFLFVSSGFAEVTNGPYRIYYPSGKLKAEVVYKDGKFDGPFRGYYENGQLSTEIIYKNGELTGEHKKYYENGQLEEEEVHEDDNSTIIGRRYYKNGQLALEFIQKKGLPNSYKAYQEDGAPLEMPKNK